MTQRERNRRAEKYRRMAGELYHDLCGKKSLPHSAKDAVNTAHDALCRAFTYLERGPNG